MVLGVYSVFDKAVNAFLPPFFCRAKGEAIRVFSEAANDKTHMFSKNAMDYTLFELAVWDDANGLFAVTEPTRILSATECLNIQQ